jgi:hypothetical protein
MNELIKNNIIIHKKTQLGIFFHKYITNFSFVNLEQANKFDRKNAESYLLLLEQERINTENLEVICVE